MIVSVPVFKTLTHLPPYMGMMLALGVVWLVSEYIHPKRISAKSVGIFIRHTKHYLELKFPVFYFPRNINGSSRP